MAMGRRMKCRQVQALFSEWQEQRLEPALACRMEAHLERCCQCAQELKAFQATWRVLHMVPPVEPPRDFVDRTLAALPFHPPAGQWACPRLLPLGRWIGVGAAVVVFLVGVWCLTLRRGTSGDLDKEMPRLATSEPLIPTAEPPLSGRSRRSQAFQSLSEESRGAHPSRPSLPSKVVSSRRRKIPAPAPVSPPHPVPGRPAPATFSEVLVQGQRYLDRGQARQAIALLEPWMEQIPSPALRAAGYRQLAQAYQTSYRLKEALQALQQARRLDPQGTPSGAALAQQVLAEARAFGAEGQAEEAAQLSQALLSCQAGEEAHQAAAVALVARCQAAQRQPELEQATWARLVQEFPTSELSQEALWRIARAQEQEGNESGAVAAYQQLFIQIPREKEEWLLQARALKRAADLTARQEGLTSTMASQYIAARNLFKQVLRETPDAPAVKDGTVLLEMAQVQEALQQKQEAVATYVKLLQQHPNTDSARQAQARLEELI